MSESTLHAARAGLGEGIFRFFASLKLTLANLLLLVVAMMAGTFVNPNATPLAEIERSLRGRPVLAWLFTKLELYDLFRSWWFTLLLLSLAVNIIAGSIDRLPGIFHHVWHPEKRLDRARGLRATRRQLPGAVTAAQLSDRLSAAGYKVEVAERDGGHDLFAERGRFSRFGAWIVHAALLVVLGGGLLGRGLAWEGRIDLPQNGGTQGHVLVRKPDGTLRRLDLGFFVRCDGFRLKTLEGGRPNGAESDLVILADEGGMPGRELHRQTVSANHPLRHAGVTLYQIGFEQLEQDVGALLVLVDRQTAASSERLVAPAEPVPMAGGARYAVIDYAVNREGRGEAIQIQRTGPGGEEASSWSFLRAPPEPVGTGDRYAAGFSGLRPLYATSLQTGRDPSTPVIYAGCWLLFAGLLVSFGWSHRRVWARLDPAGATLASSAHRNQRAHERELDLLCDKLPR